MTEQQQQDDLASLRLSPLGEAFVAWVDARPTQTGTLEDLRYYGELAAFSAGWSAAMKSREAGDND